MAMRRPHDNVKFTYADYLNWSNDERWEIIEGTLYNMTPAPSRKQQEILGSLYVEFANYLADKSCKVYMAPFDVRLPDSSNDKEDAIHTVVQPDITIICDKEKLDEQGCKGTPDLIVEILSPATAKKDRSEKLKLYERVGVKEYWIVDPVHSVVEVFNLEDLRYIHRGAYNEEDKVTVSIFNELEIDLSKVLKS